MQLVEPAIPQSSYKKKDQVKQVLLCDDKNCQSTKCIHMWPVKSAMKSRHMQSVEPAVPQKSYKQCQVKSAVTQSTHLLGTQPEVTRNIKIPQASAGTLL